MLDWGGRSAMRVSIAMSLLGMVAMSGCGGSGGEFAGYTCEDLAEEAVRISAEAANGELMKVRDPQIVTDNRETFEMPQGVNDALVLECQGMGVWNSGVNYPVLLSLTVDADGDGFVYYEAR